MSWLTIIRSSSWNYIVYYSTVKLILRKLMSVHWFRMDLQWVNFTSTPMLLSNETFVTSTTELPVSSLKVWPQAGFLIFACSSYIRNLYATFATEWRRDKPIKWELHLRFTCLSFTVSYNSHFQWHSYTRAHKGLGPGNFLSALVTFEVLTSMLSS